MESSVMDSTYCRETRTGRDRIWDFLVRWGWTRQLLTVRAPTVIVSQSLQQEG